MKQKFLLCVACIIFATAFGQSPNSFKYQAIIRDADGTALPNTEVHIMLNLLQGTVSGNSVCEEIFVRTTNDFGLANLNLGSENPTAFSNIAWGQGPYFIKLEVDFTGGGSYVEMGTSQLMSVPYALYAENSGNMPAGNAPGDMQYWNGTEWVMIPAGLTNQTLTFCDGMPQWGQCGSTNLPPLATDVSQSGQAISGSTLTGSYTYFDEDGDLEGNSLYQWYQAEDASGLNESPISGATGISYFLSSADITKYIRFAVTPLALTGDLEGEMVMAENFIGPITPGGAFVCGDNITVEYTEGNIAPVTKTVVYGTVLSNLSGSDQCWITQNLGADHQADETFDNSEASAGWYFQFNQKNGFKVDDDGTRTPDTTWYSAISGNIDWEAENDPCASLGEGWRIPTVQEWHVADSIGDWTTLNDAFASELKLHAAGIINNNSGNISLRGTFGYAWSSNTKFSGVGHTIYGNSSGCAPSSGSKSAGITIRCIKD